MQCICKYGVVGIFLWVWSSKRGKFRRITGTIRVSRVTTVRVGIRFSVRDTEPFRSRANSLPAANQPIGPWPIHSLALSLPGHFVP